MFSACLVSVYPEPGGVVLVVTAFAPELGPGESLPGTVESRGDLRIGRDTEAYGYCDRTIELPDRTRVIVSAENRLGALADLCQIAEIGAETAISRFTSTGIGTRPDFGTPGSLALVDACSLLDTAATRSAVPGLTGGPQPGYANWICSWGTYPQVGVYLSRLGEPGETDGRRTTVAGREVLVFPGGYDDSSSCLVLVQHRRFTAANGEARIEAMQLTYSGAFNRDELCRVATELAARAIPLVPPP